MEVISLKNKENSMEKLHKINLQTFNENSKKQNKGVTNITYKEIMPSINYFGAGSSDEDKSFKDFFNKY